MTGRVGGGAKGKCTCLLVDDLEFRNPINALSVPLQYPVLGGSIRDLFPSTGSLRQQPNSQSCLLPR
jgi:hypothetical protein